MNKKQNNTRKNKTKKQLAAFNRLKTARQEGPKAVLKVVLKGNRFIRQVVEGRHLLEGVQQFVLNEKERAAVEQHMYEQAEKFRVTMDERKEMKELLAWAILKDMETLTPRTDG